MKFLVAPFALSLLSNMVGSSIVFSEGQRRKPPKRVQQPGIDYTRFSHTTHVTQQKQSCDSCHKFPTRNWNEVRKGDAAFADVAEFPEHGTCLNCHRQQFFARERPAPRICSNCHAKATPAETSRYPFPSLGEAFLSTAKGRDFVSDFRVHFPHDKHPNAGCEDCHQTYQPQGKSDDEFITKPPKDIGEGFWLKKGTFKTRPLTHAQCFTCHNQESELVPLPPNCDACHKLPDSKKRGPDFDQKLAGTMGIQDWWTLTAWRSRSSAGAFRHEIHPDLDCKQCHQPLTNVVPVRSCGGAEGCHVTATLEDGGILNYEIDQKKTDASFVCTKCHLSFGKEAVPSSHLELISKVKK
jgi:Class III cytochrome C family/Cytochrome c7 and related cytochrome c